MARQNGLNRVFTRYLATYMIISIIPLLILSIAASILSSKMLLKETTDKLASILKERDSRISNFMDSLLADSAIIAEDPRLAVCMRGIESGAGADTYATDIKYLIAGHGFYDILLIAPSGNVITSYKREPDFEKNVFNYPGVMDSVLAPDVRAAMKDRSRHVSNFGYYEPSKKYAMFITMPVNSGKNFLGVAAFQVENDEINSLVENYSMTGKSGELLVGIKHNEKILFISKAKRGNKNDFETIINIGGREGTPMQLAVAGGSGAGPAYDYFGVKVLAAWTFNKKTGWGIVVKEDYSEVMAPVFEMNMIFLFVFIIIIILAALAASRAAAESVWPIIILADAAKNMARGDLGARAIVNTNDEIQVVADNFNEMAAAIQGNDNRIRAINEKLIAETKKVSNYLDVAEALIVELDSKGNMITMNRKAEEALGYSRQEITGKNWFNTVMEPDKMKEIYGNFIKTMAGLKDIEEYFERNLVTKTGVIKTVYFHHVVTHGADGKPVKSTISGTDITNLRSVEKELRQSEEYFRSTFEQAQVGVVLVSPKNKFIKVNEKFCRMTGYTAAELYEKSFAEITSNEDVNRDLTGVSELVRGEKDLYITEKKYIRKDGATFWAATNVSAVRKDGVLQNFAVIIEDISDRKKAEEDLASTLEKLERSNKELEQFAFVASHDLQEPLRAITGYLQLLDRKYSGKIDADADSYIKSAVSGAGRMRNLINDLLTFSRVESREKELKEIDMNNVFDTVLYGLGNAINESAASVTRTKLPSVMADETHMVQLLQNLIANGIKFRGADKPQIVVSAETKDKDIIFSVKDNGIGIEKEYFEKIFIIFQRLHSRDEYPGTGIGLAICKRIVESYGGRIWVESEPGKGSAFYFTLK
jgi:PAS domain S-box-containing protein